MVTKVWMFLLAMTLPDMSKSKIVTNRIEDTDQFVSTEESRIVSIRSAENDGCLARLEHALNSISTQRVANAAMIDLTGYALHQQLRTVPLDMYVTDMKIKAPTTNNINGGLSASSSSSSSSSSTSSGSSSSLSGGTQQWVKVEKCRFDQNTKILQAKLLFQDLVVTSSVRLFNDQLLRQYQNSAGGGLSSSLPPIDDTNAAIADKCNMTLRLRQSGLGFVAAPQHIGSNTVGIRTSATFVDPNFISIHAYNCQPPMVAITTNDQQRSGGSGGHGHDYYDKGAAEPRIQPSNDDVNQEMEDVFLRGIRSLLTKYMEKQLQPALKDALMLNLGYTISYGKRKR